MGVDDGVEGLIAFAVPLALPGADEATVLEADNDALGGQLAEVVGVEVAREMDRAGASADLSARCDAYRADAGAARHLGESSISVPSRSASLKSK